MAQNKKLQGLATQVREHIIEMSYGSKSAEIGSSLCIADILITLYFAILDIDPKQPERPDRDHFVLSKGHGAAAMYATMALRGYFPETELKRYRVDGGRFHCHPCRSASRGIEVSTGSLGHGLPIAIGMALTMKSEWPNKKVFVLVGDGECNEGSIWEAAMFASSHKLSNVVVIIDDNKFQGFGATDKVHPVDLSAIWTAFGWNVLEVDGHDIVLLEKVLLKAKRRRDRPTVVIAHTISGKGIPHIENTLGAHYYTPDEITYLASQHA